MNDKLAPVVLRRSQLFLLTALAAVITLGACGGGGGSDAGKKQGVASKKEARVHTTDLKSGAIAIESAGPATTLNRAIQATLLGASQRYLDTAVYGPLNDGKVGAGYGELFDTSVRASATGADAVALTDSEVGKVKRYSSITTPVEFSGLADNLGTVLYLSTRFNVTVKAEADAGALTLAHTVEFTWAPAGGSRWQITAYRVLTNRKTAAAKTTTTAQAGGKAP